MNGREWKVRLAKNEESKKIQETWGENCSMRVGIYITAGGNKTQGIWLVYLSGLETDETIDKIDDDVKEKLVFFSVEIKYKKLNARQDFYSSFHITLQGAEEMIAHAAEIQESQDTRTVDTTFWRFWVKRDSSNGRIEQQK